MQDKLRITKRILIVGAIAATAIGVVVTLIGFIFGSRTATQFSDGCTYAGAILFLLGWIFMVPLKKKKKKEDEDEVLEPQGSVKLYAEDPKRDEIISDLTKGRRLFALFSWTSALLVVFGILIYTIFG
jgi:hypothetical protein